MPINQSRQKKIYQSIWGSNIFTFLLLILLVLSFVKVSKEVLLRYRINQEINQLENQLSGLEEKNSKMQQLISYLQTDKYIEKEARLQLNLAQPGEKQINLPATDSVDYNYTSEDTRSNPTKWFHYFFEK